MMLLKVHVRSCGRKIVAKENIHCGSVKVFERKRDKHRCGFVQPSRDTRENPQTFAGKGFIERNHFDFIR